MSTATDSDTDDDVKLEDLCGYMLTTNELIYAFYDLRIIVRRHDATVDDRRKCKLNGVMVDKEDCSDRKKELDPSPSSSWRFWSSETTYEQVEFNKPELIITDKGSLQKMNTNRNLKYPVTPAAIKEFLDINRKYFKEVNDGNGTLKFNTDWRNFGKPVPGWLWGTSKNEEDEKDLLFQLQAEEEMKTDQKILEYDDTFANDNGGLVQGLLLNTKNKWLCVVFRGSVGSDDFNNANFNYNLSDNGKYGEGALIQEGFSNYLMGKRGCDVTNRTSLERIIASMNHAFEKNPEVVASEYKLYSTGHSLGGALATVLAFHVAHLIEKNDDLVRNFPRKITAVTFAAPLVGNADYNVQYEHLEKKGFLRHVRTTNVGDPIPSKITMFGLEKIVVSGEPSEFVQNGLNLILCNKTKTEIAYRITNTFGSQLSMWSGSYHGLQEYKKRWFSENNEETRRLTVKEIYKKGGVVID